MVGPNLVCAPAGFQQAPMSQLLLTNLGRQSVVFSKGQLLSCGEVCTEVENLVKQLILKVSSEHLSHNIISKNTMNTEYYERIGYS